MGEEEELDQADNSIQFNIAIALDRDSFLRRTCASCGRDFKTEVDPNDLAWALNSQIYRASLEIGVDPAGIETQGEQDNLSCPYCQHVAEASEMHTEETTEYLKRFALRDYALPMLNRILSEFADSLGNRSSGGGLISLSISMEHNPIPLPIRPLHGPEPADMKIVDFLCCGKKMKIADNWMNVSSCIFCGTAVTLI